MIQCWRGQCRWIERPLRVGFDEGSLDGTLLQCH